MTECETKSIQKAKEADATDAADLMNEEHQPAPEITSQPVKMHWTARGYVEMQIPNKMRVPKKVIDKRRAKAKVARQERKRQRKQGR